MRQKGGLGGLGGLFPTPTPVTYTLFLFCFPRVEGKQTPQTPLFL